MLNDQFFSGVRIPAFRIDATSSGNKSGRYFFRPIFFPPFFDFGRLGGAKRKMAASPSHEWENIKENTRPVKSGYKMSSLTSLLSSPPSKKTLQEEQR